MHIAVLVGHAFDVGFAPSVGVGRDLRIGDGYALHRVLRPLFQDAYGYLIEIMLTWLHFEFFEGKGVVEVGEFCTEQLIIRGPDVSTQLEPGFQLAKHIDFALQAGKLLADVPYIGIGRLYLQQGIGISAALVSRELGRNANALGNVTSQAGNGKHIDRGAKGQVHFKIALGDDLLHV